ncbi:hypothetical protein LOTGIDRAFT_236409 [Lottia gigantea]|uniref:Fibronectin type-III domain-containing protein n=1 Tax=Lottia gigantea TaxID=225164 RepID=V3YZS1_LOTGI|nr:hypothetical protein LOTGIDRAFT_236409 [Lottia gigantea]ESO83713.1 hypothetical protein LOTGIDRAFT_236409 [Lottia gigantea]
MKKNILILVTIHLALFTLSSTSECPQIHHDCQCTQPEEGIHIKCRFQDNDLINITLINSTGNEDIFIKELDLESNNLTSLPSAFFNGVTLITHINLRDNEFTDVPDILEDIGNITCLDLEKNKIKLLNMTAQNLRSVQSVNFAYNQLDTIILPESLHSMILWNFSNNFLEVVPENLWSIAGTLDLSDNIIQNLPKIPECRLNVLNLDNNNLTEIPPHTFEDCKDLQELKLRGNRISKLDTESLSGLDVLYQLHLDRNHLSSLKPGVFSSLHFLFTLSLAQNRLSLLEPANFKGIDDTLQQLILSGNQLSGLRNDTFSILEKLHRLDLSFNEEITDISDLVLPPHLASLDLQNCSIRDLHSCKLMKLTDLQEINLADNNLTCSCHLSMLFGWYKDRTTNGYTSRPQTQNKWECTVSDSDVPRIVTEDIKNCGRHQDIEQHCEEVRLVVYDFTPIKVNTSLVTSDNLITIHWEVEGDKRQIVGYKVSYESDGKVLFESPVLGKNQRTFVISFVSQHDQYSVCVDVVGNATSALTSSCETVSGQSLDYLIGIMAGVVLLLPCIAALLYILRRDKRIKEAQYSPLDEKVVKRQPNKSHTVVVEVSEAVNVEHAVCPYHENKAFNPSEETVNEVVHKSETVNCDSNKVLDENKPVVTDSSSDSSESTNM